MDCKTCKEHAETRATASVPLYAVEGQDFRRERSFRGAVVIFCVSLLIISIIVIACVVYTYKLNQSCLDKIDKINQYWLDFISQYDFYGDYTEYTQDGKGLNVIGDINGDGNGVYNGTENEDIPKDNAP